MADTGWLFFDNAVSEAYSGSDDNWDDPGNALIDDVSCASVNGLLDGYNSDYLKLYGLAGHGIPGGSTIDGIELRIERKSAGGFYSDHVVRLHKDGTAGGDNKKAGATWPASLEWSGTYGGAADMWSTGYDYSDIIDSGFGVKIAVISVFSLFAFTQSIYRVNIKVHYTEKTTLGAVALKIMGVIQAKIMGV